MDKDTLMNEQIKASIVRLVTEDGKMIGEVSNIEAQNRAKEKGLDLIQVSSSTKGGSPVCKLADYGKIKYKNSKSKKNQSRIKIKEIKYNFSTADHDIDVKHKNVLKFLSKHYHVKYIVELKGREKNMVSEAHHKMEDKLSEFESMATWKPLSTSFSRNKVRLITTLIPLRVEK